MASKFFSSTQQAFSIGFGSSMTIVTTTYRYKPPPKKRKAVALAGPAIVRRVAKADQDVKILDTSAKPAPPADDDRKPAIVTTTSRKRRSWRAPSGQRSRTTIPRRRPGCGPSSPA
jgi:hypothetical protein